MNKISRFEDVSYGWEAGAPRKPRLLALSLGVTINGTHGSTSMEADPQAGQGMIRVWCDTWGGSKNDRDGCIRTRQVPVNAKRGLSLHAQRPQQSTPPSIGRVAKRTWFKEARAPHPPRPIFKHIILPPKALFDSTVIGSFVRLSYLQEWLLEAAGWSATHIHTHIYIYIYVQYIYICTMPFFALKCIPFAWPLLCKRKAVEIRNICLCAEAIESGFLSNTF